MRKGLIFMIFTVILLLIAQSVFSQDFTQGSKVWLSMYFEIQKDKMELKEKLKGIDSLIAKNEQTIRETNELLAEIQKAKLSEDERQRFNAIQAEQLATKGLLRAKETQRKLREQKMELQMALERLNMVEQRLRDSYSKIATMKPFGFVKECSGGVKIMNLQTKRLEDACSSYTPLQEGDVISTSTDGRVELKILDGRGNFILGPNSTFVVRKDAPEEQAVELINGKAHIHVEKSEKYSNKMRELIESYKQDLKTIKGWADEKIEEIKNEEFRKRKLREFRVWLCKKIRYDDSLCEDGHSWVIGTRGTEVIVERDEEYIGKISVIEGAVEVTDSSQNKKFVISEGYTAIINLDGSVKQEKTETIDKWWSK